MLKAITVWKELKQNNSFVVQENYLEDNHAAVFIIPLNKAELIKTFHLYKNKAGIWKISWMALQ
jgi:predicted DNA binding protein